MDIRSAIAAFCALAITILSSAGASVEDTKFTPDRGFHDGPVTVTISSATPGALISYTTNGSAPTASGGQPSPVAVNVDRSMPLRAMAYVADGSLESTNVDTQTYVILNSPMRWIGTSYTTSAAYPQEVINSLKSLPALFISMDPSDFATVRDSGTGGIGQSGGNEQYERACSAELYYPDHPRYAGFAGFQIDAGLRPHSWVTTKRSFRLYFKREYGTGKLKYPVFESAPWGGDSATETFDKLVLRNHSNDGWEGRWGGATEALYLRDQFARACQIDINGVGSRSIWTHLFINGAYYGLYNPSERPDDDFLASYLGGSDDDYLGFNHGGVINENADTTIYNAYRNPGDLSTGAAYDDFQQYVDAAQFSDYLISSFYNLTHSHDWPVNGTRPQNFYGGNRNNPPQPTLHFTWDFEASLVWDSEVHAKFKRGSADADREFIRTWFALVENDEFLQLFADKAYRHLFNGGALSPANSQARLNAMANHVEPALAAEKWQWGSGLDQWTSQLASAQGKLPTNPGNLIASMRDENYYPDLDPPEFRNGGVAMTDSRRSVAAGFQAQLFNPNGTTGSIRYTTDGSDPRNSGSSDGGDSTTLTISGTTVLKARVQNGAEWSALHEMVLFVDRDFSALRITEIMYHPADELAQAGLAVSAITGDVGLGRARIDLAGSAPADFTGGDLVRITGSAIASNNGTEKVSSDSGSQLFLDRSLSDEPASPALADLLYDGNRYEFVEIKNTGSVELDLSGVTFSKGIDWQFPDGYRLAPGAFAVIANRPWDFTSRYPGVVADGEFLRDLDNGGEKLELSFTDARKHVADSLGTDVNGFGVVQLSALPPAGLQAGDRVRVTACERVTNNGSYLIQSIVGNTVLVNRNFVDAPAGALVQFFEVIETVDYGDSGVWPLSADGFGYSLVREDGSPDWRASSGSGGSPGSDDPVPSPVAAILVNEALTHTDLPQLDSVELFHPGGTSTVDLGGWWLTDDLDEPGKFRIPNGTMISAGGFLVLDETNFGSSFLLSSTGDELYLFSPDFRYSHGFDFGASENGVSFGRHLKANGEEVFVRQTAVTLGAANSGPRVGPVVISEIHYHPLDTEKEFLELTNISTSPVDLGGWSVSGIGMEFPTGTTIQPNEVLLAGEDASLSAAAPVGTQVFVFPSKLSNGGERLRLRMPDGAGNWITIDEVVYDDGAPWPTTPDGTGPSLERINLDGYGDEPANWKASSVAGGTPGLSEPATTPLIAFEPAGFSLNAIEGFSPSEVSFDVWNVGIDNLGYLVGDDASWVMVSPVAGGSVGPSERDTHTLHFNTTLLAPGEYTATISLVGSAGNSPATLQVHLVVTPRDTTPPTVVAATAENGSTVRVEFSEAVEVTSAQNPAHYALEPGGTVLSALLENDGRTVTLVTSPLVAGTFYTISVDGVTDRSVPVPNPAAPGTQAGFFYAGSTLPPGLVARWKFDEGDGDLATDEENDNTLDLNFGPVWTTRDDASALQFDGSSEYGSRPDAALTGAFPCKSSGATNDFTIAAWIRLDRGGHRHPIVTKQGSGTRGLLFSVEESNRLNLELFKDSSSDTDTQSGATLTSNTWYHVAVTYKFLGDGTSRVRLYIDGQESGASDSAVGPPNTNALDLNIGRYWWSGSYSRYFDGAIDDVIFFERELSGAEISQIYDGVPAPVATPVISPPGGDFQSQIAVTISTPTVGAQIYYTLDGSEPTTASLLYEGPLALNASVTLKARAFAAGLNPSDSVSASFVHIVTTGDWWNAALPYRVPIAVEAGAFPRKNLHCAEIPIDFGAALSSMGLSQESLIADSIRVVEVDAGGSVIDGAPAFQFDASSGNPEMGTLVVCLAGDTEAGATRRYHVYFATLGTHSPAAISPLVHTDSNSSDGGFASLRFETAIGTWQYHYTGAGFSSLDDLDGNDWINWSTANGSSGAYRGIPNLAFNSGYFHPGGEGNPSTTTLDRSGPVHSTLTSISQDGLWELRWDIYPAYARLNVVRRDPSETYWFLYEGTPGGTLDLTTDYSVRPDGTRLPLGTAWTGDLPGDEWAFFEDTALDRALYVIQHEPDGNTDSYWQLNNDMTVFGFGRLNLNTYLSAAPNTFTVGLADDASFANMKAVIESAYKPMTATVGLSQRIPGEAAYDAWALLQFGEAAVSDELLRDNLWGPNADPEGDGLVNILELAGGSDPLAHDAEAMIAVEDGAVVRFETIVDLEGIRVELEQGDDLDNWSPLPASVVATDPIRQRQVWEGAWPQSGTRGFVRLVVWLKP